MVSRNQKNFEFKLGKQGLLLFVSGMALLLFAVFIIGVAVGTHLDVYPEKIAGGIVGIFHRQETHIPVEKKMVVAGEPEYPSPLLEGKREPLLPSEDLTSQLAAGGTEKEFSFPSVLGEQSNGVPVAPPVLPGAEAFVTPPGGNDTVKPDTPVPQSKPLANLSLPKEPKTGRSLDSLERNKSELLTPSAAAGNIEVAGRQIHDTGAASYGELQPATGGYLLQVGSFQTQAGANQLLEKIKRLGYKARQEDVEIPKKGKWIRVIVDGFSTRDEARKNALTIEKKVKGTKCIVRAGKR